MKISKRFLNIVIAIEFLAAVILLTAFAAQAVPYRLFLPIVRKDPIPAPLPPLASCIPQPPQTQTGQVTSIVDGDTIHVNIGGQDFAVRYIGMDTPEDTTQHEYYGPEATARNRQLVEGKTVMLIKDASETDQYGRLLRFVYVGDVFVNYQLCQER